MAKDSSHNIRQNYHIINQYFKLVDYLVSKIETFGSMREFCEIIGIDKSKLSRFKNHEIIDLKLAQDIAAFFGIQIELSLTKKMVGEVI